MNVIIIIPAYNEEENIKAVVESIYKLKIKLDILVVNDGSTDNTSKVAKKTGAIVIDLPNNLGIGGAVQTGYLYALRNKYDIAIQLDGDGQHDPKDIIKMIEKIEKENYDMVIGSRFIKKTNYKQTFFRMVGIKIMSFIIKTITGKKIYDTTSGYRAINKDIIKEFTINYPYDYPEPETNMRMIMKNKKIIEIPVEMRKRMAGKSFVTPIKSIKYMIKVILSLLILKLKQV